MTLRPIRIRDKTIVLAKGHMITPRGKGDQREHDHAKKVVEAFVQGALREKLDEYRNQDVIINLRDVAYMEYGPEDGKLSGITQYTGMCYVTPLEGYSVIKTDELAAMKQELKRLEARIDEIDGGG